MQASVHTFDPETRTGSVLRDDGVQLSFDAHAFDASGLRLLRSGQRLTVEVVDDLVVSMRIVGIGQRPAHPLSHARPGRSRHGDTARVQRCRRAERRATSRGEPGP